MKKIVHAVSCARIRKFAIGLISQEAKDASRTALVLSVFLKFQACIHLTIIP